MIKKLIAISFAAGMFATGASAATLNALAEGNSFERGEASGYVWQNANTGGLKVTLTSNYNPYFDADNAGLGVCKVLDAAKQCNPSSDDNVTGGGGIDEWVELAFEQTTKVFDLLFRDENHNPLGGSAATLLIGLNGGALTQYTFAAASATVFSDVKSIRFQYDGAGRNPDQFYLTGAGVTPVPVPAALPLLIGGLGIMGWVARRRKAA